MAEIIQNFFSIISLLAANPWQILAGAGLAAFLAAAFWFCFYGDILLTAGAFFGVPLGVVVSLGWAKDHFGDNTPMIIAAGVVLAFLLLREACKILR